MALALLRPVRDWWSAHADVLVVVVVAVLGQQEVWTPRWALAHIVGPTWLNSVAYLACAVALYWRRRAPLAVLAFVSAVGIAQFLAVGASQGLGVYLPWLVSLYSLGRYAEPRALAAGAPLILAVYAVHEVRDPQFAFSGSAVTFWWILAAAWPLGWAFRRRERQHTALRAYAEVLDRERELRDEAAAGQERARIAREMHDVVGHALSIIVLQTVAALGQLEEDNSTGAHDRLTAVETTARLALDELRRTVGLLQPDRATTPQPPPGLDRLDDLVDTVRAAGVPVDLLVEADTGSLPPGLVVAAYRIIQEALTNVIKHAGPCRAAVTVRQTRDGLELNVIDDGRAGTQPSTPGRGLLGMRERTALYGGRLQTGPATGGGYRVCAWFPTTTGTAG